MGTEDSSSPVLVIGAGVAGLGAALALARAGCRVTVLEANARAGGCCATTSVSGFRFNDGALYVAVPSLLAHAFDRLGLDLATDVPMVPIAHPLQAHLDDGTVVWLSSVDGSSVEGPDGHARTAMLRDGLGRLQREWGPIYRTLVREVLPFEPSLPRTLAAVWRYLPRLRGQVDTLIASTFPDPGLQAAVASLLLYTGVAPRDLPVTQVVGLVGLLEEGFWLPREGMDAIPLALVDALATRGVTVRTGARVARIAVERDAVQGVVLDDGERIGAARVLATCSGFDVARRLLDARDVPARLARTADAAPMSHRAVSLQLGCGGADLPDAFVVNHVPPMDRQGALHEDAPGVPRWLAWTSPSQVLAGMAPAGKSTVELFAPASGIASAADWSDARTADTVARYTAALNARMPGLTVDAVRVRDPRDFERHMHLYEGALYGIAPGAPPHRYFPHGTRIGGLHLAGQTTFPGFGVATALLSGVQAAEALLRRA